YKAVCSKCNSKYTIKVIDGKVAKVTKDTEPVTLTRRVLLKLVTGTFLSKKEYILSKGSHYVGREDESKISDFSIKDKYASSRSVRIDVNENGGSLVYKLEVEKATNPVYHNNTELVAGDIIYLMSGDTIKLGKTLIKIQKLENKK
ncbi:MAG: FHA domain-containing protein, partial [Muribaculaceae bacterium]